MKKIGMLTSGGDCQALNAAMRGVVKALAHNVDELEIYGFENGYKGLIYENYRILTSKDFSGILTKGGTILGSSRQPFKLMRVPDENGLDKVAAMKNTYKKLGLDCLVILGGNGTQKTANLLREEGLNVIHLPKTIDNDIYGTDVTFGFQSAINIATDAIDCIHTTAASHNRVFIVEVMGHKVGWLTLYAGVAGGADIILLPEIPYDIDKVVDAIHKRTKEGKGFTILAVAEGAISKEDAALSKKEYKKKLAKSKYPSVSYEVADRISERLGHAACAVQYNRRPPIPATQRLWHPRPPYRSLQDHGWCNSSPLAKTASWKAAPWLLTTGLHFVNDDCSSQYNHGSVQCEKRPSTSLLPNFGYKKTAILIPKNCGVQHFSNFLA